MDKLEVCKTTRKIAAQSLSKALQTLLKESEPISEVDFRDAWLKELRTHKTIFPDGWYTPPPHGMGVIFASDKNIERLAFKSLRPEENWPQKNIYLDKKNGVVIVYASPVDKKTGIIGDFGMTLYFGKNQKIKQHMSNVLNVIQEVFEYTKVDMRLAEIYEHMQQKLAEKNLANNWWISVSDPTGINIGHTIPDGETTLTLISKKRKFLNSIEQMKIKPGLAFTIEPRPQVKNDDSLPVIYFHTIALFKKSGEKELLTDFDEVFKSSLQTTSPVYV